MSFVFSEDSNYIYAVTITHELDGGTAHHMLYVGKYTISTDTWSTLHSEEHTAIWSGCDIDLDASGYPMVTGVSGTFAKFFYRNTGHQWTSKTISSVGSSYDATVIRWGDYYLVHVGNGSGLGSIGSSSKLYQYAFINGHPNPPDNWSNVATPNMSYAQIAKGGSGAQVGFLAPTATGLKYRSWAGASLSSTETVISNTPNTGAWGLCWRGGVWHAMYASGVDEVQHLTREGSDVWVLKEQYHSPATWKYFGMTTYPDNPTQMNDDWFAATVFNNSTRALDNILVNDWSGVPVPPGDNYWPFGAVNDTVIFGTDVNTEAVDKDTSMSSLRTVMDVVEIEDSVVFTRGAALSTYNVGSFFVYTDEFKDWYSPTGGGQYMDKNFLMTTGYINFGNNYRKYCTEIIVDIEMVEDQPTLVAVLSDAGSRTIPITIDNNKTPLRVGLWGRYFRVYVYDFSQDKFGIRSIELSAAWYGTRR
jgi:hypothetical protein